MTEELLREGADFLLRVTVPGAAGGVTLFLVGLKRRHYRNNRYFSKFTIEVFGALLTASFLASLLSGIMHNEKLATPLAFLLGIAWSSVVQTARTKITNVVQSVLNQWRVSKPRKK